jgi:hypothetical protein
MAVLDFARGRAAYPLPAPSPADRSISASRQPRRLRIAVEICGTLFALMLIAFGVLALRLALVLAHGFVH